MANGKVCTGFSKPYVALYSAEGTTISYASGTILARGVEVSLEPESSDGVDFYADNTIGESVGGVFTGGTVTLTVDGLKKAARNLIMGVTTTESVTVGSSSVSVSVYDDDQKAPYVGIGFLARYMEDGTETWSPVVLTKCVFDVDGLEAATQEENIEFQTEELTATIMRDDSAKHAWRKIADDQTSESAGEDVLKALLNIS